MIQIYVHQPVEFKNAQGKNVALPKGMAEIELSDLEKIKDQVSGQMITFILPINGKNFFQKSVNQWIYNFLLMFQAQEVEIKMKAQKGDPGLPGHTPTETEITAIITKVMPQVPLIQTKRVELKNIALGLKEVPVTWDKPYADSNYGVFPSVESSGAALIQIDSISKDDKTVNGCKLRVKNLALTGTQTCWLTVVAIGTTPTK